MTRLPADRLARLIAHATATFEHGLLARTPTSVSVVSDPRWLVVHVHESFTPVEWRISRNPAGARRVREFHHFVFEDALDALVDHVQRATGVRIRGGIAHVDTATGSVLKTFTTHPDVDLFLFGEGLPALGVSVDAHLHANGTHAHATHGSHGQILAIGNGAVRA
jgi:uncharacterized protein YbcI